MNRSFLLSAAVVLGVLAAWPAPARATGSMTVSPLELAFIDWEMPDPSTVRFHLQFHNIDSFTPTLEVSGTISSQEFGVFLQNYGTIGTFTVPPIEPESFFDVYFDVPLASLPGGGSLSHARTNGVPICPPLYWTGNVDVTWSGPGGSGQANMHNGQVAVSSGGPPSDLHVLTGCSTSMTWSVQNLCAGWSATLLNEDFTAAPAELPAGWSGWIRTTAALEVPVGSMCCFNVDFSCYGVVPLLSVWAYSCDVAVPTRPTTWGRIRTLYR